MHSILLNYTDTIRSRKRQILGFVKNPEFLYFCEIKGCRLLLLTLFKTHSHSSFVNGVNVFAKAIKYKCYCRPRTAKFIGASALHFGSLFCFAFD